MFVRLMAEFLLLFVGDAVSTSYTQNSALSRLNTKTNQDEEIL